MSLKLTEDQKLLIEFALSRIAAERSHKSGKELVEVLCQIQNDEEVRETVVLNIYILIQSIAFVNKKTRFSTLWSELSDEERRGFENLVSDAIFNLLAKG